jgi:prepilin peptidase CpaA
LAAVLVALTAAFFDLKSGVIPGWLTLGSLASAPLAKSLVLGGFAPFGLALLGAALCALLPLLLYRAGGMGSGDVQLLAAVGALLPPFVGLHAVTYAFLVGGAWAIVLLARQGRLAAGLGNAARLFSSGLGSASARTTMTALRFGPAAFLGTLLAVLVCWRDA